MASRRRRRRHSQSRRHRQWALWALAGMLIVGLLASRQWLAQQAALESAASSERSKPAAATPPARSGGPTVEQPLHADIPELLPKPTVDPGQSEVWRPGDATHGALPTDWTGPSRYTPPNPELISALHEAGLRPEVLQRSGDLRVQRLWQGGRSQIGVVETAVTRFAGQDWRAIYAIAHRQAEIDPKLATRLIRSNAASTLSAWSWDRGYWFARIHIPADARREALISAVDHVLIAADDLEKELSGAADEF